ncbi:leucine-rich repeat domain-containing protein [Coraliomargarita sp. SDUM461004]|uniref:Leucine-rich repeat domain-containing protein n=1 Tax=Thalassobacterium sedimentorum TaxID=3041258 RepID=A0ABU1AKR4_9BACT|nr:leucine-rich repeat domain-containing protein [Coraliomargarita sp. SDUM461004]MDQ8195402.1 leucine-rich repeat domain-containing protein [Coraliomargarita sp. SDUM461004]
MHRFIIKIPLVTLLLSLLHTAVFCHDLDDFVFHMNEETVEITEYVGTSTIVTVPSEIDSIPVQSIGRDAFRNSQITEITLPDSILKIQAYAFEGCNQLTTIQLSAQLLTIGESAFEGTNITAVNFPQTLRTLADSAFMHSQSLTSIQFPMDSSELSIGINVFSNCDELLTVSLPTGLQTIPAGMFSSCNQLQSVTLNDDLKSIATEAFAWCPNLQSINFPDGLTTIGNDAFVGSGLNSVDLPSSLSALGTRPFSFSDDLIAINVSSANSNFAAINGVLYDKEITKLLTFPASKPVTDFQVPDTVQSIGLHAFANHAALEQIHIPPATTEIDADVFYANSNLHSVHVSPDNTTYRSQDGVLFDKSLSTLLYFPYGKVIACYKIPEGVTSLSSRTFFSRPGIDYIVIPEGVTTIKRDTFSYSSIQEVIIPASVHTIETDAFNTPSLNAIYFSGNAPTAQSRAFYRSTSGDVYATGYISETAEGFSAPLWQYAYPYNLPILTIGPEEEFTIWKLKNEVPHDTNINASLDGIKYPILLPYALNLNPQKFELPMPQISSNAWIWKFDGARTGITYMVEQTNNLSEDNWSTHGITISAPDSAGQRTATGSHSGEQLFLRILVNPE